MLTLKRDNNNAGSFIEVDNHIPNGFGDGDENQVIHFNTLQITGPNSHRGNYFHLKKQEARQLAFALLCMTEQD